MAKNKYYRSQSLNAQWVDLSQSISTLLIDPEHGSISKAEATASGSSLEERPHEITTKHWADSVRRTHCIDSTCGKKFTLTERKHHCRKCGEVFCGKCTQYRRRLSVFATPDCDGILYRVCKRCFDVGPQTLGTVQQRFHEFAAYKELIKTSKNNQSNEVSNNYIKLNYEQECQRLVDGFKGTLSFWKIKNLVVETLGAVKVPDWQKSKHWVERSDKCLLCYKVFSLTELKSHCRVCGNIICTSCVSDMLIIYMDNNDSSVRWCLINIIGSPDQEPAKCVYLKVCNHCHAELAEIQGCIAIQAQTMEVDGKPIIEELTDINEHLSAIQVKILATLPKFEQLVDAVEAKGDLKGLVTPGQSATQTVAKYYLDLSDQFTKFAVVMQSLKKLKPKTNTQVKLAKNFTSSKFCFYNDHFSIYRQSKKRVEEVLPVDVLEGVQKIVDEQSINSAYIVIKQLCFEALHLDTSHKLGEQIPTIIASCEKVCFNDLQKQLNKPEVEWEDHLSSVDELLQIQLKKHRLVKPSSRKTKLNGDEYVRWFLLDRTYLLLSQIIRQLSDKTADKKFSQTKGALKEAQEQINQLKDL